MSWEDILEKRDNEYSEKLDEIDALLWKIDTFLPGSYNNKVILAKLKGLIRELRKLLDG
jgi:hypothetical protein